MALNGTAATLRKNLPILPPNLSSGRPSTSTNPRFPSFAVIATLTTSLPFLFVTLRYTGGCISATEYIGLVHSLSANIVPFSSSDSSIFLGPCTSPSISDLRYTSHVLLVSKCLPKLPALPTVKSNTLRPNDLPVFHAPKIKSFILVPILSDFNLFKSSVFLSLSSAAAKSTTSNPSPSFLYIASLLSIMLSNIFFVVLVAYFLV